MGVLLDKEPVPTSAPVEKQKSFSLYVDKYKTVVAILSVKVNEKDDCLLDIEFDHSIAAPHEEISAEVGRLIIEKLESSFGLLGKSVMVKKNEEVDGESV